jgi:phage baseplate assembly protein W
MAKLPHFSYPFRFAAGKAVVSEQDSPDEVADCVTAILLCPVGYRVELPEFGTDDVAFSSPSVDTDKIREAVGFWEPRASLGFEQHVDANDQLIARIRMAVEVRTEELSP